MKDLDPRLTPARPDLAAAKLRGVVAAERFVEGRAARVTSSVLDLRPRPRGDIGLSTQLLHGEPVTIYDEAEGWAWVQSERDGYTGYVHGEDLGPPLRTNFRVTVNRTFVYPAADMKRPVQGWLPLDARVAVEETAGSFARLRGGGFVWRMHLAPVDETLDFVATAEGLLGTPYLWGGRSADGIDCSGLVQIAASLAGLALPRDSDMQQAAPLWAVAAPDAQRRRGDLLFWPGHVAIMTDPLTLVHANGHHMMVVREPAAVAETRIRAATGSEPALKARRW